MARAPSLGATPTAGSGNAVGAQTRNSANVPQAPILQPRRSPLHDLADEMGAMAARDSQTNAILQRGLQANLRAQKLGLGAAGLAQGAEAGADRYLLRQEEIEQREDALDEQSDLARAGLILGAVNIAADAGLAYMAHAQKQKLQEDGVRASKAETQYELNVGQRLAELDPLDPDYDQQVGTVLTEARQAAEEGAGFVTEQRRQEFSARMDELGVKSVLRAAEQRRVVVQQAAATEYEAAANLAINQITASPSSFESIVNEFSAKIAPVLDAMAPRERAKQADQFARQAVLGRTLGLADIGKYDEAKNFLLSNGGDINPVQLRSTMLQVDNIERRRVNEWKQASTDAAARLKLGLVTGTVSMTDVMKAVPSLAPGAAATLLTYAETMQRRQAKESGAISEAYSRFNAGLPVTPKMQDQIYAGLVQQGMNEATKANGGAAPPGATALNIRAQAAASFVQTQGVAPPAFRAAISAAERSGSPDAVAQAAYLVMQARKGDPDGKVKDGAGVVTDVVLDMAYGLAGGEPTLQTIQQAAQDVLSKGNPEVRQKQAREAFSGNQAGKTLKELANGLDTPAAIGEFEQERRRAFLWTGDVDRANTVAANRVAQRYRPTSIGGGQAITVNGPAAEETVPRIMRETLGEAGVRDALNAGVRRQLQAIENSPWANDAFEPDAAGTPAFYLEPDDLTKRQREAGQPASFVVRARSPLFPGVLIPVPVINDDGSRGQLRYTVPGTDEEALATVPEMSDRLAREKATLRSTRDRFSNPNAATGADLARVPSPGASAAAAGAKADDEKRRSMDLDAATDEALSQAVVGGFAERLLRGKE